jgi:uncharacterized repeat protein (TIGR01451 family)
MFKESKNRLIAWSTLMCTLMFFTILVVRDVQAQEPPSSATRSLMALTPTPTFTPTSTPTFTPTPTPTSTPTSTPVPPPVTPAPKESEPSRVERVDPVIVKRGEPSDAVPGELVDYYIQVSNEGQDAAVDVVVTDEMPDQLEILSVETTQGTVSIVGQQVRVEIGVVGQDFVVDIIIHTRVREGIFAPVQLTNLAVLTAANSGERTAATTTSVVSLALPVTGISDVSVLTLTITIAGAAALVLLGLWEGKQSRQGRT